MKSKFKNLLEILKELIPGANPDHRSYGNMQLIPVPVRPREEKSNPYNTTR